MNTGKHGENGKEDNCKLLRLSIYSHSPPSHIHEQYCPFMNLSGNAKFIQRDFKVGNSMGKCSFTCILIDH